MRCSYIQKLLLLLLLLLLKKKQLTGQVTYKKLSLQGMLLHKDQVQCKSNTKAKTKTNKHIHHPCYNTIKLHTHVATD